ncbi:MAG: flagellar motor protein MotB [Acidimicrobiia bacterium]
MLDRRLEDEEHENHERWLVSYADMITLLAALFIVLFAMSRLDLAKFQSFAKALSGEFGESKSGILEDGGPSVAAKGEGTLDGMVLSRAQLNQASAVLADQAAQAAAEERSELARTQRQVEERLRSAGLGDAVSFRMERRGLVVSIVTDDVLFRSGAATLESAGRAVLDRLAPSLAALPNQLAIEGHTDDEPVRGGSITNWELSTGRATAVLRYLVGERAVPSPRVYAAGYADQRPLVPNDTVAHRAENRRVEIVVLTAAAAGTEPVAAATTTTTGERQRRDPG